jgi:hypothetical protein
MDPINIYLCIKFARHLPSSPLDKHGAPERERHLTLYPPALRLKVHVLYSTINGSSNGGFPKSVWQSLTRAEMPAQVGPDLKKCDALPSVKFSACHQALPSVTPSIVFTPGNPYSQVHGQEACKCGPSGPPHSLLLAILTPCLLSLLPLDPYPATCWQDPSFQTRLQLN